MFGCDLGTCASGVLAECYVVAAESAWSVWSRIRTWFQQMLVLMLLCACMWSLWILIKIVPLCGSHDLLSGTCATNHGSGLLVLFWWASYGCIFCGKTPSGEMAIKL